MQEVEHGMVNMQDGVGPSGTKKSDQVLGKRKKSVAPKRGGKIPSRRGGKTRNSKRDKQESLVQESQVQESQVLESQVEELFQDTPVRHGPEQEQDTPSRWTKSLVKERTLVRSKKEIKGKVVKNLLFDEVDISDDAFDMWLGLHSGYTHETMKEAIAFKKANIDTIETEKQVTDERLNDEPLNDEPLNDDPLNDKPLNDEPTGEMDVADIEAAVKQGEAELEADMEAAFKKDDDELVAAMKDIDAAFEAAMRGKEHATLNDQDEQELAFVQHAEEVEAAQTKQYEDALMNELYGPVTGSESDHENDFYNEFEDMDFADEMEEAEVEGAEVDEGAEVEEGADVEEEPVVIDAEPRPKRLKQVMKRRRPSERIMLLKMKKGVVTKDGSGSSSSKPITLE